MVKQIVFIGEHRLPDFQRRLQSTKPLVIIISPSIDNILRGAVDKSYNIIVRKLLVLIAVCVKRKLTKHLAA